MPAQPSQARIDANRRNAQKSTGPRTEAGKARSCRNAMTHGMAGRGIALPNEDRAAVEARFLGLQAELAPTTILGAFFVHDIALATVRTQRAALREAHALAYKVRHAAADFDEARLAEAEYTLGYIGMEPVTYRRRLLSTVQGVDLLVQRFRDLHRDLTLHRERWDSSHEYVLEAYLGRRGGEFPATRSRALSQAIQGHLDLLDPDDRATIEAAPSVYAGARTLMLAFLEDQVADLLRLRDSFDLEAIELDRAEAAGRAMFDAGKEAQLARRYEAAARRDLYRALEALRAVEAAALEPAEAPDDAEPEAMTRGDAHANPPDPDAAADPGGPNPLPDNEIHRSMGSSRRFRHAAPAGLRRSPDFAPDAADLGPDRPPIDPSTLDARPFRPDPPR